VSDMRLPTHAVLQHTTSVESTAHAVGQARAAAQTTMDPGAYGQLCQFLPAVLGVVFEAAVVTMNGSTEALQETALNLRSTVSLLQTTDDAGARSIGGSA
jgi:hypothetical protein